MKLALFFDTETTGLPDFKAPSDAPQQPHIVQLAAALVDLETRQTVASMDVIVKPNGWTIPVEMAAIHGITTERAHDVGISEEVATNMLLSLWGERLRIGHNEQFDARILRIALKRFHDQPFLADDKQPSAAWKAGKAECTIALSRPFCKLAKNKAPKLGEAYEHFFGKQLENAHSAMADVQGCIAVYFAIQDQQKPAATRSGLGRRTEQRGV